MFPQNNLVACRFCGERFTAAALRLHRPVCPERPTGRAVRAVGVVWGLLLLAALACAAPITTGDVSLCEVNCLSQDGIVNEAAVAGEPIYYSTEGYTRFSLASVGTFCVPSGTSEEQLNRLANEQMHGRVELATWPNCYPPRRIGGNQ